jgi:hypothetical protein
MKRILVLTAGSLSAAGAALGAITVISAAPAVADEGCVPNFACDVIPDQPNTFLNEPENGILNQPTTFGNSIVNSIQSAGRLASGQTLAEQARDFVVASCGDYQGGPVTDDETRCGLVAQPGHFWANEGGTGVSQQLDTFLNDPEMGILNQPQTFLASITDPFGVDGGPGTGAPGDNQPDAPEEPEEPAGP